MSLESSDQTLSINTGKIFVEIGCRDYPVPSVGRYAFWDQDKYFGIDPDERALERAQVELDRKAAGVNATLLPRSAEEIPLDSDTVDEVFMGNVLGEPRIDQELLTRLRYERDREWIENGPWHQRDPKPVTYKDLVTIPRILKESHRILKPKGLLVILEDLTPPAREVTEALLADARFMIHSCLHPQDVDWHENAGQYTYNTQFSSNPANYLVVARKSD